MKNNLFNKELEIGKYVESNIHKFEQLKPYKHNSQEKLSGFKNGKIIGWNNNNLIVDCGELGEWIFPHYPKPKNSETWNKPIETTYNRPSGKVIKLTSDTVIIEGYSGLWEYSIEDVKIDHSRTDMNDEQYLWWLNTNRDDIKNGRKLIFYDDTTIGDKETYCSWGLHQQQGKKIFDIDCFPRVALEHVNTRHKCPLDIKKIRKNKHNGCFHSCRVFQRHQFNNAITVQEAITLYDEEILRFEDEIENNQNT